MLSLVSLLFHFNARQSTIAFHTETSHLICSANQLTGFYIELKTGLKIGQTYSVS